MIVSMGWGRPHQIVVYDLDDRGELAPCRTIRNGEPDPERRWFSCRVEVWRTLQALARDHGWAPAGTTLDPDAERRNQHHAAMAGRGTLLADAADSYRLRLARAKADVGYDPQPWAYAKVVSGADAAAMADALERVLAAGACQADDRPINGPVFVREGMTREEYAAFNRALSAPLVQDFVVFLRRGPFKFARDED